MHPDDERYRDLVGRTAILPLVGRELPIIADDYVKPDFGTGALKITPGHDPNDFEIGRRHGLPEVTVIGEDGRMTADAGEPYAGLDAAEARASASSQALRGRGPAARRASPTRTTVPFSHRSGERIEPLISLQWFMRHGRAGRAGDRGRARPGACASTPSAGRSVYLDWMENIRPWCISRQLWWGHQLPVWYRGDETYVGMEPPREGGLGARPRRARHLVLQRAVAVRHARLARATPPSCTPSTRPTCSRRRATSSSCGSRG